MAGLYQKITQRFMSLQSSNMAEKCDHCVIPASDDGGGPSRYYPNSSDMFSSKFPEGLRVLVFDEDPQYLSVLEKYLQEFQYEGSYYYLSL